MVIRARVKLHRLLALSDRAVSTMAHCDLAAITPSDVADVYFDTPGFQPSRSAEVRNTCGTIDDLQVMKYSTIYMTSALAVTRCLSALIQPMQLEGSCSGGSLVVKSIPLPHSACFACCAMQAAYTT